MPSLPHQKTNQRYPSTPPRSLPFRRYVGEPRQVAGYTASYEGLAFATVKGAGHMVPQFKPAEALAMFGRFLAGEPL